MEKERKVKVLSLVALIVAVLGLTVAFAALSQTLTINGTASVNAAEWDIHFDSVNNLCNDMGISAEECAEIKEVNTVGAGQVIGTPTIGKNEISNLSFSITKPEDSASYAFFIRNTGTIDAKIENIDVNGKGYDDMFVLCPEGNSPVESCDWDGDGVVSEEDRTNVMSNISVKIEYNGDTNPEGNILKAGEHVTGAIKFEYSGLFPNDKGANLELEATSLPKRNLQFNNLTLKYNFVQAD